jgi:hypothetical protein
MTVARQAIGENPKLAVLTPDRPACGRVQRTACGLPTELSHEAQRMTTNKVNRP